MFKKSNKQAMITTLIASSLGLIASIVLSYEALILAANKDAVLSCDINAVVSCAAVANHWSATLLGIPNSFIGMIAMPVVMTVAVVLLTGAKLPKWFMQLVQLGAIAGLVFAGWMFYMSYSVIGILCPWCLITDVAMIALFFGVTRYNILSGVLPIKKAVQKKLEAFAKKDYDQLAMWSLLVLMVIAIVLKFGEQLFS